jgi:dolichol-phosphate mannosyltransferase
MSEHARIQPALSVVLPTYEEAASIAAVVQEILDVLAAASTPCEVLVLDDTSPDGTADLVDRRFADRPEVRAIRRGGHRGLAASVLDGLKEARAEWILVMDADFNHDPQDLPRFIDPAAEFDIVSGSRFLAGGGMYSRQRQLGSHAMNLFARLILRTPITDSLAGFFAIRRSVVDVLPADRIFWGYGDYYIRLLWHARRQGARILEIPVRYRAREAGESKTPLVRTALRYGFEIVRLALQRR